MTLLVKKNKNKTWKGIFLKGVTTSVSHLQLYIINAELSWRKSFKLSSTHALHGKPQLSKKKWSYTNSRSALFASAKWNKLSFVISLSLSLLFRFPLSLLSFRKRLLLSLFLYLSLFADKCLMKRPGKPRPKHNMFVAQQGHHNESSLRRVSLRRTSSGLKRDVLVQRTPS